MNKDKYVFAQLVEFLDSFKFRRIVAKYNGDRYVKHLTCWNQFLAIMFGQLAKECGIEMPETRLFDDKYFGVERFDRTSGGKLHVVSIAGLIGADYRMPSINYSHIFQVCAALTHSVAELWKVYRLMVFNYLIENKDDHAKNFAFIYRGGEWHISPAYDLLPSDGMNGYHTTSINDSIEPTKDDLIAVAVKVGLNKKEAEKIYNEIEKKVKKFRK